LRFNTEANEKEEWYDGPKLKKGGAFNKNKLISNSKNMLKMSKMSKL
jgi:hypothetical protein